MKRHHFNTIEKIHKAGKLLKDGVLIAERTEGFCKVQLYQVDSFYLEVYRHSHFNVITKVNSFIDTVHLEPYLKQIDINGLV
jgi:hypothetical protein